MMSTARSLNFQISITFYIYLFLVNSGKPYSYISIPSFMQSAYARLSAFPSYSNYASASSSESVR